MARFQAMVPAAIGFLATLSASPAGALGADATIADATRALGAERLNSILYAGHASTVSFGQTFSASGPWRGNPIIDYTRAIDLARPASRARGTVTATSLFVGGTPVPGPYNQSITPANGAWAQQLEIWVTPWGFLKGAAANRATVRPVKLDGKPYRLVSWSPPQRSRSGAAYTVNGYVNEQNLIDRVETWVDNDLLGDLHVEVSYQGYKDFGSLKVPTRIVQRRLGWPLFEATVTGAEANPANIEALTAPVPPLFPPAPDDPITPAEKLAEGVYRIPGSYAALAVGMKDYVIVLEGGGQGLARGAAVLAEAKRLFPGRPVRYVMSTHPHSDHTAGMAPFVADGVTVVTHRNNAAFFDAAFRNARTLVGDELARSKARPKFWIVDEKRVLKDADHAVEFYHLKDVRHSDGFLIAYLPKERILFQGDFSIPPTGADPSRPQSGAQTNEFVFSLVENLDRLDLWDFDLFVPVHPPTPYKPWTRTDLLKAVGRPTEAAVN